MVDFKNNCAIHKNLFFAGKDSRLRQMEAIREQQEKLARLHFEVGAEQVFIFMLWLIFILVFLVKKPSFKCRFNYLLLQLKINISNWMILHIFMPSAVNKLFNVIKYIKIS